MNIRTLCLSASALTLMWAGAASAQSTPKSDDASAKGTVKEVVITAERRITALQKTSIAATVLNGDDLIKQSVNTVDQIQFISPSVTVNNFGQGNDFDIRGIGKGEHNTQTGTGVVTYRDGVATFPGYFQEEPYYDVANLEVLRGPQGTFSGQNATGGAVYVTTRDPEINGGHSGYLFGHFGNYTDTGLQGAVNLPINDTLAARLAFNTEYRDSFYNVSGPWKGDGHVKWGSLRLSFLWEPNPQLRVSWKTDYNYLNNGGYFGDSLTNQGTHNLFTFSNNYKNYARDQGVRSALKIDYLMANGVTFRSLTGVQTSNSAYTGDIDGTALPAPNFSIAEDVSTTEWTQEFNLISPNTGPFKWVLGAYYQNLTYNFPHGHFDIGFPPGFIDEALWGTNWTYTEAAFGQMSYDLPHGFQFQAGARYSYWSTKNVVNWAVPEFFIDYLQKQTYTGDNVTGKVGINWNADANNYLYAFVATGAKPGGLNGPLIFFGGLQPGPFKQEYVTDYEVGWKSTLADGHLHTQLGAYYNLFQNFQVIVPIPTIPQQSTEMNVPGNTKLYGVEASAQGVFGDFSFNVGVGLSHSSLGTFYTEDPRLPVSGVCNPTSGPASVRCINLAGHPQTYAPDVTFNVMAAYDFHLADGDKVTPMVTFSHISQQWATLFDNRAAGDYLSPRDIAGASLAWTHQSWVATLYSTNINDERYVSAVASPLRLAGAPRQYGVSVMKKF
jgi:iron complex outermembrane receptor protein